jgi:glyoxylase-like metal-dependent hydrolase (beta-lactamase superfamily II)
MGSDWFTTRQLDDDVFLIGEPPHVNSFLVVGDERAALIDSGMGIGRIRPVAESLTDRPIEVVNTHYHWDHSGGNEEFERTAIHELGAEQLAEGVPAEDLAFYRPMFELVAERTPTLQSIDEGFFAFLSDETTPRPLPDGFDPTTWSLPPRPASRLLRDGERIGLGGRSLTVLHTPGHTPDSSCLLDEHAGILFGGDTVNTGPMYAHQVDSNVDDFAASTARLATLATSVRSVYVAHYARYKTDGRYLVELADGFADIVEGRAAIREVDDDSGKPVRIASFPTVSVVLPAISG